MEITVEELNKLDNKSYKIIDIRSDLELEYGAIDNATHINESDVNESIFNDKNIKYIICCRRGITSKELAEKYSHMGLNVYSLEGGYNALVLSKLQRDIDNDYCKNVEHSLHKKYKQTLWGNFTKALKNYKLVNEGDKVAVCISGGKDSMLMAKLFQELKKYSEVHFDVEYLVMDPGYSKENRFIIEENCRRLNIPAHFFESDIFDSVYNIEKSPCYLCARMRRGHLYTYAEQLGCNKIALGHHYDDVIETVLMGMLYGAQIQTMMPKLHSTNFNGMELIRPLYLIREENIKRWRDENNLHFIQCACKFTDTCTSCNNEENQSKRIEVKNLIKTLKETNPEVDAHIFKSMENVCLDTVIGYKYKGERHHFLDDYDSSL